MALNTGNAPKSSGSADFRFKPDANGRTLIWFATNYSEMAWGFWAGFFKSNKTNPAPIDISWVGASANCEEMRIATELGGKPVRKGFPLVIVKNNDGSFEVKLWEISATNLEVLRQWAVDDGVDLAGKAVIVQKVSNKWTVGISTSPKHKDLTAAELAGIDLPDSEFVENFLGPADAEGVRNKIMERMNVTSWHDVRVGFGLEKPGDGGGASYDELD